MSLKDLRDKLNTIDDEIMKLLDKRYEVINEVGRFKLEKGIYVENLKREEEILLKTSNFNNFPQIKETYQKIIDVSKATQNYNYFLLGHKLPYSLSLIVHEMIGEKLRINNFKYQLFETYFSNDESALASNVINNGLYKGMNVTNPHKVIAYNSCQVLDLIAKKTGVCNTLVKDEGLIKGYNTDYYGALNSLKRFGFNIANKKVLLIGNGATSKTLKEVLLTLKARKIVNLVRTVRSNDEIAIENYYMHLDSEFIINTTPYGTSPNFEFKPLFPLDNFTKLEGVFDCIYNPINTPLIIEAKKYKIKAVNGLYMLINQAVYSEYLFNKLEFNKKIEDITEGIYKKLLLDRINIVFIGMPYSGKSYKGRNLARLMNKVYVDTDKELEKDNNSLEEVLLRGGTLEDYRNLESSMVKEVTKKSGLVISTGGGVVTIDENNDYLKLNSMVIYIHQELDQLISRIDKTRPLVKGKEDLEKLYRERKDKYLNNCDLIINGDISIEGIKEKILEVLYENLSN